MKKTMKKILSTSLLISLILPSVVLAQVTPPVEGAGPPQCCKLGRDITIDSKECKKGDIVGPEGGVCPIGDINCVTEKWGIFCLINTLHTVVNWIFVVLIALAVLFVIMGAFQIVTAGGDPGKVTTGRTYILYAAIGLIVAFIARAIPSIVKAVMGY